MKICLTYHKINVKIRQFGAKQATNGTALLNTFCFWFSNDSKRVVPIESNEIKKTLSMVGETHEKSSVRHCVQYWLNES